MRVSMSRQLLQSEEKITNIINYLISRQAEITVRIEGKETEYSSRFIEILPRSNGGGVSVSHNERPELVMEKLVPAEGNSLIQQFPEANVEFLICGHLCRCPTKYVSISTTFPHYGLIMSAPVFMELEEKRKEQRVTLESPEFISAMFKLNKASETTQSYELNIFNYAGNGLGLLLTEKDFDLLERLNPGDKLPEITLYAESALTVLDGIVRHKTKIEDGTYQGSYIIGLESNTKIDFCEWGFDSP
jgi:hypothetical protein